MTDLYVALLAGLGFAFYLTVRSWTNAIVLVVSVAALIGMARDLRGFGTALKDRLPRLTCIALVSPLLAVLFSQLLRGELVFKAYDAPARIVLGGMLFVYLLHRRINLVRLLEWIFPLAVVVLAVTIALEPSSSPRWEGRFATYFVDPITLGQYAVFYGFACLFMVDLTQKDALVLKALKYTAFPLALWIAVGTGARGSWVAAPVLLLFWLILVKRHSGLFRALIALGLCSILAVLAYHAVDVIQERIDLAIREVAEYSHEQHTDTSVGLRLSLWRSAWHLFLERPLSGYGDGNFPPLSGVPAVSAFYTPLLEHLLINTGVHNEFLQNMLRSGIFGLVSSILMFVVPLVVFWRGARSRSTNARAAGLIGLCYVVAMFLFGFTTECFSLKYTASFYGLIIAALSAQALQTGEQNIGRS